MVNKQLVTGAAAMLTIAFGCLAITTRETIYIVLALGSLAALMSLSLLR